MDMQSDTRAAHERLRDWLVSEGRKGGWVAEKIGVDRATFSLWLCGHRAPHHRYRGQLEALTGGAVPQDAWEG